MWNGLIWLAIRTRGGLYEYSNEPLGPIKYSEFLDWLRKCLDKDSAAWSLSAHELWANHGLAVKISKPFH